MVIGKIQINARFRTSSVTLPLICTVLILQEPGITEPTSQPITVVVIGIAAITLSARSMSSPSIPNIYKLIGTSVLVSLTQVLSSAGFLGYRWWGLINGCLLSHIALPHKLHGLKVTITSHIFSAPGTNEGMREPNNTLEQENYPRQPQHAPPSGRVWPTPINTQ